jgi:hypothetical protein
LQFLIKKKKLNFFPAVIFFQFLVIKGLDPDWIRIRIGIQPQTLDPDPDPEKLNSDPKPCFVVLPDAERGYGHPGENHVHRSTAGLVHQQEGEVCIRDPLKQRQHLIPHKTALNPVVF